MKPVECAYEAEALAAVLECRWPARVDEELREHVGECAVCSDVLRIACSFERARDVRALPDSGHVWRMAQLRARLEASETAARPILAAQVIALVCALGLIGGCFVTMRDWVASGLTELNVKALVPSATAIFAQHGGLILVILIVLLAVPAAVCVALVKE